MTRAPVNSMWSKQIACAALITLFLTGCDSAEDKAFVADCQSKRGFTQQQCSCVKDLINDGLEDKGQRYVKAIVLGNQSKAAQIQSSFGIFEGTGILARAAWISANAVQACGISI